LQISEKSAVLSHIQNLAVKKPPHTELDAVELYDEALEKTLGPEVQATWAKTIGEMRWQCVKAMPKNEDASLKCFQACLARHDLDHARQVSFTLTGKMLFLEAYKATFRLQTASKNHLQQIDHMFFGA
jgi:N-terminal acetyltransferase B complex non-catalytic subunit